MAAYRKGRAENNECKILIFVENSESFLYLYKEENWPTTLAGNNFSTKKPSIPPQLALVIPAVSLQINWDDFVQDLKDNHPSISNVVRLKNKAQQPIRAVKLEFNSVTTRRELLEAGEISVMHIKYKVAEFYTQANVLICSNCFGIGHFRKNCPQKNESTCKTCSEKYTNLKDHLCSGVLKCIHCGGPHVSNDAKCRVVQDYRAALTRNLLNNITTENMEHANAGQLINNVSQATYTTTNGLSYANVLKMSSSYPNDLLLKKLDSIVKKVEEESIATRHSLEVIKNEMRNCYDGMKQQVETLEEKLKATEKKFEDFSMKIGEIVQNICATLLYPQNSQGQQWKSYWQEKIKTLVEARSTSVKST
ncbi:unnamed protein product [Rotaria sp. Silwood2]|nr:unnamed protein product [Rotaria sp. Silwood2]CAF3119536.1 unnamed protein product [Rotaria sp. Silwood2]CAF3247821.1 unnamed protein product [Rotaria sp. Silwood2]CAF4238332.1 unnamed protein product [Rotaria sp. Silwood2]CAF4348420.1 unnamed protein product [Rotaria sp. Silwood2]